jgi:hypothetical protein
MAKVMLRRKVALCMPDKQSKKTNILSEYPVGLLLLHSSLSSIVVATVSRQF